jgi:hypothetical protein
MITTIAAAPVTADAVDPSSGAALLAVVAVGALLLAGVVVLRSLAALAAVAAAVATAFIGGLQALLMVGAAIATVATLAFGGDAQASQPTDTPSVATVQGTPAPR